MSKIIKLDLTNPDANLMIINHGEIQGNTISIDLNLKNDIFLPSMYKPWIEPQMPYIHFNLVSIVDTQPQNDILYIFDTWGTSSYYHLLIDHIIPVWITKQVVNQYLLKQNETIEKEHYLRISTNNYKTELPQANNIFKHFLGEHFTEKINGKFKYIVYGYCYNHRPFHGRKIQYYPSYQEMINKFLLAFVNTDLHCGLEIKQEKYIILTKRDNRNVININILYERLCKEGYNVKLIDFSKHTIQEQIQICANAYAMIGSEGAAFTNQLFMQSGSLLISITNDMSRNNFHTSLAQYLNHDFHSIQTLRPSIVDEILRIIQSQRKPPPIPYPTVYDCSFQKDDSTITI
jgi:hypothetical protein